MLTVINMNIFPSVYVYSQYIDQNLLKALLVCMGSCMYMVNIYLLRFMPTYIIKQYLFKKMKTIHKVENIVKL